MVSAKKAKEIAGDLSDFTEDTLSLIHKLTKDAAVMKKWLDTERRLANMQEVVEQLGEISWEDKADEIYSLCSEAEDEVRDAIESVNSWRKKLGIELEPYL